MAQRLPTPNTRLEQLIIDEAQAIKNPGTQLSQTVKAMHAQADLPHGNTHRKWPMGLLVIADFATSIAAWHKTTVPVLISSMDAETLSSPS